jgi:hypothetical protein
MRHQLHKVRLNEHHLSQAEQKLNHISEKKSHISKIAWVATLNNNNNNNRSVRLNTHVIGKWNS